jgi:hypothetical protein
MPFHPFRISGKLSRANRELKRDKRIRDNQGRRRRGRKRRRSRKNNSLLN